MSAVIKNNPDPLIRRALDFATAAHSGQIRKYTARPYIEHPLAVAGIVRRSNGTVPMIAAALLHDVVEDTHVTQEDVVSEFGGEIGNMVYELTDQTQLSDGNRATRKKLERIRLGRASPQSKTIKLADLLHNAESIVLHDADFAKMFLEEMRLLLDGPLMGASSGLLYIEVTNRLQSHWNALNLPRPYHIIVA